jgi:hypothetical protein
VCQATSLLPAWELPDEIYRAPTTTLILRKPRGGCSKLPIRSSLQGGRIHIEKVNWPFLSHDKASPTKYGAGMKLAIERGWLVMHERGTFVRFTAAGADFFA